MTVTRVTSHACLRVCTVIFNHINQIIKTFSCTGSLLRSVLKCCYNSLSHTNYPSENTQTTAVRDNDHVRSKVWDDLKLNTLKMTCFLITRQQNGLCIAESVYTLLVCGTVIMISAVPELLLDRSGLFPLSQRGFLKRSVFFIRGSLSSQ